MSSITPNSCVLNFDFVCAVGQIFKAINENFTTIHLIEKQREAHFQAKQFLEGCFRKSSEGMDVSFISPPTCAIPKKIPPLIKKGLNPKVFNWAFTKGVEYDIQADGGRGRNNIVIYTAASQFNAAESPGRATVLPGEAVSTYQGDHTQGPQAQLAFFGNEEVEKVNLAANMGFNGLCNVFDEHTKGAVQHGYLTPRTLEEFRLVIKQLEENGSSIEYLAIEACPPSKSEKIHLVFCAAAAFGSYRILKEKTEEVAACEKRVQFLCAFHAYRAQFSYATTLARACEKPVVLKAAALGVGAYGNDPQTVAQAFYCAAKEMEKEMLEADVTVEFQVFKKDDTFETPAEIIVRLLGLDQQLEQRLALLEQGIEELKHNMACSQSELAQIKSVIKAMLAIILMAGAFFALSAHFGYKLSLNMYKIEALGELISLKEQKLTFSGGN